MKIEEKKHNTTHQLNSGFSLCTEYIVQYIHIYGWNEQIEKIMER